MEINDMVLVIYNDKGTEKNCLMTKEHLEEFLSVAQMEPKEYGAFMFALGSSLGEDKPFAEHYIRGNQTVFARLCKDEEMLESFLQGVYNEEGKWRFEKELTSKECMDKLSFLGIDTRGWSGCMGFHYVKMEQEYHVGDVLTNLNHRKYRVMEKFSSRNLLLMDVKNGNFVVGVGVETFTRCPKGQEATAENAVVGIEWGHGIYLPNVLSAIDFRRLRIEYGDKEAITNVSEYRDYLNQKFKLYHSLSKDPLASDSIKAAATNAMYEEFGTGRPDTFSEKLSDGDYDKGFTKDVPVIKERSI